MSIFKKISEILQVDGWDFVPTGPDEWEWVKFDSDGKPVARCGDETWARDCASARESIYDRT